MSNASAALKTDTLGDGPFIFDMPVKASTAIYKGTLIAQHSGGYAVPYSTSGGGCAIGVAQHNVASTAVDGSMRIRVETKRAYAFTNGAGGDAFSETSKYGCPVSVSYTHLTLPTSDLV